MKTTMSRCISASRLWAAIWMAVVLVAPGCDSMSFVPPPPPELSEPVGTVPGSKVSAPPTLSSTGRSSLSSTGTIEGATHLSGGGTFVELILAKPPTAGRTYLIQALRRDLGKATMVLRYTKPESTEPRSPEEMAAAIRKAVGRGSAAIIVEPTDDPSLVNLLYETQARGTKILLLDQPVPPRDGKTIPCVKLQSLEKPGKQIVDAVIEAARLTHSLNAGRIVVIQNRATDAYSAERLASLTEPLKAAGLKYELLVFNGNAIAAKEALVMSLAVPPKISIVLAEDDDGFAASHLVLTQRIKQSQPDFVLGGYTAYDIGGSTDVVAKATAFCDRSVEHFSAKTFQAVRNLIDGKPVAERIEVPVVFHHSRYLYVPAETPKK